MKYQLLLITAMAAALSFTSGCASKKIEVNEGEWKKLYAPSGLYTELYVDSETPDSPMVTISSTGYDPQMVAYYDGVKLEKLIIAQGTEGILILVDGDLHDAESFTFKTISKAEDKKEVREYRLEQIETNNTTEDEPVATGQRR